MTKGAKSTFDEFINIAPLIKEKKKWIISPKMP
jgi:hypothetical protein